MNQVLGIGIQDFEKIRQTNNFYIDKTAFIKEWWETNNEVTLITRPRRFGKTLTMSMLNCFFSNKYKDRADLFEGLSIWKEEKFRQLQGTYPVIYMTFANVKPEHYEDFLFQIKEIFSELYLQHQYLLNSNVLNQAQKADFLKIRDQEAVSPNTLQSAIHNLSMYLQAHFDKKVIILLDEYDTPLQEAYLNGYWDKIIHFMRVFFNSSFKTTHYMERVIMTGITRVSKESIFSDFNNLAISTTTSKCFQTSFGFTEEEVFQSLDRYGLDDKKQNVKTWYDGFKFGEVNDIYNPWSIINYLQEQQLKTYWANTSSNSLISKLIREGSPDLKQQMERLLMGETIEVELDEQIIFNQLTKKKGAIWSLLAASGYLKITDTQQNENGEWLYFLQLTNHEVYLMFRTMIQDWFEDDTGHYNAFIKALLSGNIKEMNAYMNLIAMQSFSMFDSGNHPSEFTQPERFYHGFVLGLLVELRGRYEIKSNRESGFGRYDTALIPLKENDPAIIIEFKVLDSTEEHSLQETVQNALNQIQDKCYDTELFNRGIAKERIRHYGFAFKGKEVLIGN